MNEIRFVQTDELRLAESVAGLAAAPDWLRRLARDATRGAVSRIFEIARARQADFVLIAGCCTESDEFRASVLQWLERPIRQLRADGIQVVMAGSEQSETDRLADFVIHPGERLHVTCSAGRVRLGISRADMPTGSDLAVSPMSEGPSAHAACNYLFRPQTRYTVGTSEDGSSVYSAGAPLSHGPHEQGAFGCLVVDAHSHSGQVNAVFESTDPLRFELREIDAPAVVTSQSICDAVVDESRELARQQRRTTVVDWQFDTPLQCAGELESWRQEAILESVRRTLQEGHLGVWPRRIIITPSHVSLTSGWKSTGAHELTSLLFEQQSDGNHHRQGTFAELVTGARLLRRSA